MLAFSLTTLAQIGPSPPAPSGTPCTPSTSCKHSCGAYTFDLSGFNAQMKSMGNSDQPPHPDYYKTNDGDTAGNHDYYFGPCVALTSAVSCDGSIATAPVAIQTWQDGVTPPFPSDSCGALGDYSTQQCTASSATSLQCTYSGGDQSRQVTFIYTEGPLAPPAAQETQYPQYTVTFTGPLSSDGDAAAGGLSGGSLFLILFLGVALPVYLGGGWYYNHKYKELQGVEAVPQIEYWRQLPGLVKDGCIFSYKETNKFIKHMSDKHSGASADPALKQALADDEGASSTAYEENKA